MLLHDSEEFLKDLSPGKFVTFLLSLHKKLLIVCHYLLPARSSEDADSMPQVRSSLTTCWMISAPMKLNLGSNPGVARRRPLHTSLEQYGTNLP